MALQDFRRLVDVGPYGHVAIEIRAGNAGQVPKINLDVSTLHLELDEADAGAVFDALAAALRVLAS